MNTEDFRKELVKIMPGYEWTVHRPFTDLAGYFSATGIQSSGFNRLSTLQVVRREPKGSVEYEVKSSGFGKKSPWLSDATESTLLKALRSLQNHYEHMASLYASHARALDGCQQTNNRTREERAMRDYGEQHPPQSFLDRHGAKILYTIIVGLVYAITGRICERMELITQPAFWSLFGSIFGIIIMVGLSCIDARIKKC